MLNKDVPRKLVIFGSGTLAELTHFYFSHDSEFEVVAFTADDAYVTSNEYLGKPCVPFSRITDLYPPEEFSMFIAVGYTKFNATRIEKFKAAKEKGYRLASYLSSKNQYWQESLNIGENVLIMEGNVIMPFCTIEDNVTVCIGNILSHHTTVGRHTFITSHVALGGCVQVGEACFFGLNATIRDSITIAPGTVVGAAANIIKPTEENGVYTGNPAVKVNTKDNIRI